MEEYLDIRLLETDDGGDLKLAGSDLETYRSWQNMIYVGLFGGNVEGYTTTDERAEDERAEDWWGNKLLMPDSPELWFNSRTERTLMSTSLSTQGIDRIEKAVISDLSFMDPFANVTVEVSLVDADQIRMDIFVQEPSTLERAQFRYIWRPSEGKAFVPGEEISTSVGDFDPQDFDTIDYF